MGDTIVAGRDDRVGRHYWDGVVAQVDHGAPIDAWRGYMQRVYRHLVQDWLVSPNSGRGLKTDLFEEAVSPHYLLPDLRPGSVGIDCSFLAVQAARERLAPLGGQYLLIVGDLRFLPLKSAAVERILSGSSLDHFPTKVDMGRGLAELARVLAPGGAMIVTFDNPHNPIIWLRNRIPFTWLKRVGLVPYYVGATYNCLEARRQLEALGLTVTRVTAVAHAPRAPAIWLVLLAERLRWAWLGGLISRMLDTFEVLERWPTRYLTGYYLAFRAEKRTLSGNNTVPLSEPSARPWQARQ